MDTIRCTHPDHCDSHCCGSRSVSCAPDCACCDGCADCDACAAAEAADARLDAGLDAL